LIIYHKYFYRLFIGRCFIFLVCFEDISTELQKQAAKVSKNFNLSAVNRELKSSGSNWNRLIGK